MIKYIDVFGVVCEEFIIDGDKYTRTFHNKFGSKVNVVIWYKETSSLGHRYNVLPGKYVIHTGCEEFDLLERWYNREENINSVLDV